MFSAPPFFRAEPRGVLGLGDLASLQATGANADALGVALAVSSADGLKVGEETALGNTGRVQTDTAFILGRTLADDDVADRGTLTADFTNSGHFGVPFVRFFLLGLAGLPLDVRERIVKRGGETTKAVAAGCLRGYGLDGFAGGLGFEGLELFVAHRHGADRKTDAALTAIDLDNAGFDFLTDLESVLDLLDALIGDLGDVNETVDTILELDERTERSNLGNLALNGGADRVLRGDVAPRIGLSLLETERDALLFRIDVENNGLDFLTLLEALGRMVDLARPAHIADVDHTVDTLFELDERTVSREVANLAADLRTDREALLNRVPRIVLGLTDAEGDLLVVDIDGENNDLNLVPDVENVAGAGNALGPAEFADVDETFDAGSDLDERAVSGKIDDLAGDAGADGELLLNRVPGILGRLLETEADALAVAIDIENHNVELFADLEHLGRVLDAAPAHIGDMEETVETVEVDERAEVGDVLHAALADFALLERTEEFGLLLGERTLDELTARDDEVASLVGNLDNLEIVSLADIGLELLDGSDFNLAAGQERLDIVDSDQKTAADGRLDRTGNDTAFNITLENLLPADLLVGAALGKLDHAGLLVLELNEHYGYLLTDLDAVGTELGSGNRALGLVTNVNENVVTLDGADGTLDDATILELRLLKRLREHRFHRGRTLRRSRRFTNCHTLLYFYCLIYNRGFRPRPPRFWAWNL